jgi:UDP-glucose:tetrahydrobiopterin glucosyltransferase
MHDRGDVRCHVSPDPLRVLVASTPVGPLGSGVGGGVELTLHTLVYGLGARGHHVEVVAPAGSLLVGTRVHQIDGALQTSSQLAGRDAPIEVSATSVLSAMWERVARVQHEFDVVVNLAYDWLPMYLTGILEVPVVHIVSMGSLSDAMDEAIAAVARRHPGRLAVHTAAQAATFDRRLGPAPFRIVGNGIVTDRYDLRLVADADPAHLGAIGRISPEKGWEDVAELSERSGWPIRVWGMMQDRAYWERVVADHPGAQLEYRGFLPTDDLQAEIGGCTAMVMTPKWVEAFGNVAVEAMATGVPVVTYDRGGPAQIVLDGVTGFVVPADDVDALVVAVGRIGEIDRARCRQRVEEEYSAEALAGRVEQWLRDVVSGEVVLDAEAADRILSRFPVERSSMDPDRPSGSTIG